MNEPSPYDTGNNKWIARVTTVAKPYFQVRFTKNIPGEYTASGSAKQHILFVKLFYFHKYKSEKSCLTAAKTVRNREAKERGLSLKKLKPNQNKGKRYASHGQTRNAYGAHGVFHAAAKESYVCALPRLDGHGDVIRSKINGSALRYSKVFGYGPMCSLSQEGALKAAIRYSKKACKDDPREFVKRLPAAGRA